MPEITRFYGIVIKLFFGDHPPPHFHALYGEYVGLFDIQTLEMYRRRPPAKSQETGPRMGSVAQKQTERQWTAQEFRKLPPLE